MDYLSLFAQAYGTDTYGGSTYSCTEGTTCTTTEPTGPLAPVTGFMREQPIVSFIAIVILAVALYATVVLLLKKRLKKPRSPQE